ncbi:MAG: tetratricopeptide repeat protein [Alphaproteobacteria bacterium]
MGMSAGRLWQSGVFAVCVAFAAPVASATETSGAEPAVPSLLETVSVSGAYLAGRFAEQRSDHRTAAILLDRVLEDNPDDAELTQRAFLAHLRAGLYDRALELAAQDMGNSNQSYFANLLLAEQALRKGEWDTALARVESDGGSGLGRFATPMIKAWALAGRGDTDAAIQSIGALSDQGGFGRLRSLHEGLIYAKAGRYAEAEDALVSQDPDLLLAPVRVIRALARVYTLQDRDADAQALVDSYIDRNPGADALRDDLTTAMNGEDDEGLFGPPGAVADGFYHLASGIREQSTEAALIFGRLTLYLDPTFDLPILLIGDLLEASARHNEAIEVLGRITADSPYEWDARLRIADNLGEIGRDDEAIELLEKMAQERPDSTDPLVKIGYLYRAQEAWLDEIDIYNRAIGRVAEQEQRHWLLFYNRGIAFERSDQWPKAEADFKRALELKPDDPFVLNYLGYSWVEKGMNIPAAKEMIRKAVSQRQNDGYIVDSLGWVLYRTGDFEEAVRHLERAVLLRPQDPVINDHLGDAYWRVGREYEARFQWDRALHLEPEDDLVGTIRDKLDNGLGEAEIIEVVE